MNHDSKAIVCFEQSPNSRVAWWLMASYLYYICNRDLLSDCLFDTLSKEMLANYDSIKHPHFHLITKEMLEAGTGHNLKESDYPLITKHVAWQLIRS